MNKEERAFSQFKSILDTINELPKWAREAVFVYLKMSLSKNYSFNKIKTRNNKDFLFLYIPKLTDNGKNYISNIKYQAEKQDKNYLNLLNDVRNRKYLVDIANDNNWSLSLVCKYLLKLWQNNIIEQSSSKELYALVKLLAEEITIDEYFFLAGKINRTQFDWARKIISSNMMSSIEDQENNRNEDVFVNLGYLPPDEIDFIKSLLDLSKSNLNLDSAYFALLKKFQDLKQSHSKLEKEKESLLDDKQDLENIVKKLNKIVDDNTKEKDQYHKEVELLKIELKKALKG